MNAGITRAINGFRVILCRAGEPLIFWCIVCASVFLVSCLSYGYSDRPKDSFLLFFPMQKSEAIVAERRFERLPGDLESRTEAIVEESLLGPSDISYRRALFQETVLQRILYRGDSLYIDLSESSLLSSAIPFDKAVSILEMTVLRNFPALKSVVICVAGNQIMTATAPAMPEEAPSGELGTSIPADGKAGKKE